MVTPRDKHENEPLAATPLSRRGRRSAWISGVIQLAQASLLCASLMLFVPSCIVADPPEYTDPVQTPPQLNLYLANPLLSQVVPVPSNMTGVTFSVPVRSEDAGEQLLAVFWEDYNTTSTYSHVFSSQKVPPSTYNDPKLRTIVSTPFTPGPAEQGCHIITLLVAHNNTFQQLNTTILDPNFAPADAAIISWWVNVDPPADAPTTLVGCPTQAAPAR